MMWILKYHFYCAFLQFFLILQLFYSSFSESTGSLVSNLASETEHADKFTNFVIKMCHEQIKNQTAVIKLCRVPEVHTLFSDSTESYMISGGSRNLFPVENEPLFKPSSETVRSLSDVKCLCKIPGHCFLDRPYKPQFISILFENLPIHSLDNNTSKPRSKIEPLYKVSAKMSNDVSRCNDSVIWTSVRNQSKVCTFYGSLVMQPLRGNEGQFHCQNISQQFTLQSNSTTFEQSASIIALQKITKVSRGLRARVLYSKWNGANFPNPKTNQSLCGRANSSLLCDPDNLLNATEGAKLSYALELFSFNYICFCSDARNCSVFPSGPKVYIAVANETG